MRKQQEKDIRYIMKKLIISFIKGCRLFFKLCAITQAATLFAPDKLLYRKIFMDAAQTRNF
ncbi:hypothetical protein [Ruminococcus sp.]|jgi:hypothetical protein|uniref:hypothetical protein n=1 Tax=Ruminococcus sp. TaxID=41978 RepID=UPI003AF0AC05